MITVDYILLGMRETCTDGKDGLKNRGVQPQLLRYRRASIRLADKKSTSVDRGSIPLKDLGALLGLSRSPSDLPAR